MEARGIGDSGQGPKRGHPETPVKVAASRDGGSAKQGESSTAGGKGDKAPFDSQELTEAELLAGGDDEELDYEHKVMEGEAEEIDIL